MRCCQQWCLTSKSSPSVHFRRESGATKPGLEGKSKWKWTTAVSIPNTLFHTTTISTTGESNASAVCPTNPVISLRSSRVLSTTVSRGVTAIPNNATATIFPAVPTATPLKAKTVFSLSASEIDWNVHPLLPLWQQWTFSGRLQRERSPVTEWSSVKRGRVASAGQGVTQQVKLSPPHPESESVELQPEIIPFECNLISECQVNKHSPVTSLVGKTMLSNMLSERTQNRGIVGHRITSVHCRPTMERSVHTWSKGTRCFRSDRGRRQLESCRSQWFQHALWRMGWNHVQFGSSCKQNERITHSCTCSKRTAVVQADHWLQRNWAGNETEWSKWAGWWEQRALEQDC